MFKIKRLESGAQLITVPMKGTRTITVLVMFATGSKYETKDNNGISHFLEHMFFKGTKKRSNTLAISSEMDALGAEFNAFTGREYTGYWVRVDAAKIDIAMDILSDILFNSKFDSKEINREKGVIIEEINMWSDNPIMKIEDIFEGLLYGDTPAGWDTLGPKENILKFKREDFLKYFNSQYQNDNSILVAAGNINGDFQKMIEKYFSKKDASNVGMKEKERVAEKQSKPACLVQYKKTDQANFSLGVRAFDYIHKDRLAAKMLAIVLGGSMSSRLFINLRERRGLAYYIHADNESYTDSGYFSVKAGVPVTKVEESVKIILAEMKKVKKFGVDKEELRRAKDLLKGRMAIQMEASDNVAEWYARQAAMMRTVVRENRKKKEELTAPEDFLAEVEKISLADLKRVAQEIFVTKNLNLAIIGPYKDGKVFESLLKL